MSEKTRWGIVGTGRIAQFFARGLSVLPDAQLVAVGSRTKDAADKFADMFYIPRRHASYADLANDPEVDAVYIATPHNLHKDNTIMCLRAGKAVICEKPFAINAREAAEMIRVARETGRFLMEAMWTRFLPALVKVRELIAQGAIGEVRMVQADFGFRMEFNPKSRLLDPVLGGGALLDVGIYPISLAWMLFGKPKQITSVTHLGQTGVDEQMAILLGYDQGQIAICSAAVRTNTVQEAIIYGTDGHIKIHSAWWKGERLTLAQSGKDPQVIELPLEGNGYNYEAAEVMRCLRAAKLESETIPLDETLAIMGTLDEIRAQWGLRYPMEEK
jgi:predicted dehydrogenase